MTEPTHWVVHVTERTAGSGCPWPVHAIERFWDNRPLLFWDNRPLLRSAGARAAAHRPTPVTRGWEKRPGRHPAADRRDGGEELLLGMISFEP
jgi:hypothetical protein